MTKSLHPYKGTKKGKLHVLVPFIDFNLNISDAAKILMEKANELKIQTTKDSLIQFVRNERFKKYGNEARVYNKRYNKVASRAFPKYHKSTAATMEIFDNVVKELIDMRQFIMTAVDENRILRTRIEKMQKALSA